MTEIKDAIEIFELRESLGNFKVADKIALKCLREKAERMTEPKPLTLEQLRELDGKPVYVTHNDPHSKAWDGWYIVSIDNDFIFVVNQYNQIKRIQGWTLSQCNFYDREMGEVSL